MRYLLDTNVCVDYLSGRYPAVIDNWQSKPPNDVCTSSIVLAELAFGVAKSRFRKRNAEALTNLTAELTCLPFGTNEAQAYGRVRARLERSGDPIGANDLLIAAHAMSAGLVLVSDNLQEFGRIAGLKIEDWR